MRGNIAEILAQVLRDYDKKFVAPAVLCTPEIGQITYVLSDETTVSHYIDENLEILKNSDNTKIIGVKITNIPALLDSILTDQSMRQILIARAAQIGVSLTDDPTIRNP